METKTQASGTFTVDSWSDETFDEDPHVKLSRAHLTKTFAGDIQGTSTVDMLAVHLPVDGEYQGAAYVAVERFTGSVHGRTGGFVLVHRAADDGLRVTVVPGSGSGDLTGLTGEIVINRHEDGSHSYTFDYAVG